MRSQVCALHKTKSVLHGHLRALHEQRVDLDHYTLKLSVEANTFVKTKEAMYDKGKHDTIMSRTGRRNNVAES